jgi:membrane associated rhomboid family serine protease
MGIYDRDYYREDSRWSNPFARSQGTLFLCLLYFFMFIAQVASTEQGPLGQAPQTAGLTAALQLDVDRTINKGEVWRVVTYALVHDEWITHVIFTIVFLVWIGHQVEDLYGTKEYLAFFLFTSLLGGIVYTAVGAIAGNTLPLLGPSGAVTAVLILFALHYPAWRFFFLPIWLIIAIYALQDVAGLAAGGSNPARVAVHLTGAAFALAYHTYTLRVLNWIPGRSGSKRTARRQPQPKLRVRQQQPEPEPAAASVSASAAKGSSSSGPVDEHLEAKLDQVLEKVQKHGKESLTESEREILLKASEIYKKRRQSS